MNRSGFRSGFLVAAVALSGCGETATLPVEAGMGPAPTLPPPNETLMPTVNIAPARGWAAKTMPTAAPGLTVTAFARGLDHPRWVLVLPNGDVLVAESNAPPKPEDGKGIKGFFMRRALQEAGAATSSADRITLLRDRDGDGVAETRSVFADRLHSPFGMALVGQDLYIANSDAVVRFRYSPGDDRATTAPEHIVDLPAGPLNHHWTKGLVARPDGARLYAAVGSNSNVAENGMDAEEGRAAIWEINPQRRTRRLFATGLRNPVGMAWEPGSGVLWTVVNERDELGSDLVPDYLTAVTDGDALGRPVGVAIDRRGGLLVADDVGNVVWRVGGTAATTSH